MVIRKEKILVFILVLAMFAGFFNFTNVNSEGKDIELKLEKLPELSSNNFKAIAFGEDTFVGVTQDGYILTSQDKQSWNITYTNEANTINSIEYNGKIFIAVGNNGTILSSINGVDWDKIGTGISEALNKVKWDGKEFWCCGDFKNILTSVDGKTWNTRVVELSTPGYFTGLKDIAYSGKTYVALGKQTNDIFYSTDGLLWNKAELSDSKYYRLNAVTYGKDKFVVVSGNGDILTSKDGKSWDTISISMWRSFTSVVWDEKNYVTASDAGLYKSTNGVDWEFIGGDITYITLTSESILLGCGVGTIMQSKDGIMWDVLSCPYNFDLKEIAASDNSFVAVSTKGMILSSADGKSWDMLWCSVYGEHNDFNGVIYANNMFVAFGNSVILTSKDGKNWNANKVEVEKITDDGGWSFVEDFTDIIWAGKQFVAITSLYSVLTSKDGASWDIVMKHGDTLNIDESDFTWRGLNNIAWNGSRYVAISRNTDYYTSDDGKSWTKRQFTAGKILDKLTWINNQFICISRDFTLLSGEWSSGVWGYVLTAMTSSDGINWSSKKLGEEDKIDILKSEPILINNELVSVGSRGKIFKSSNGLDWVEKFTGCKEDLNSLCYKDGTYVAVGNSKSVFISKDGEKWVSAVNQLNQEEKRIFYLNNTFFMAGVDGSLWNSVDGQEWVQRIGTNGEYIIDMEYSGSAYIAVGMGETIWKSKDGNVWSRVNTWYDITTKESTGEVEGNNVRYKLSPSLYNIVWDGKAFVAVGQFGAVYTSKDGEKWNAISLESANLHGLAYGGGLCVAVGDYGEIYYSKDYVRWQKADSGTEQDLSAVMWHNGKFIAVGKGIILTSKDGTKWSEASGFNYNDYLNVIWTGDLYIAAGENHMVYSYNGSEWKELTLSLSNIGFIWSIISIDGKLYISTINIPQRYGSVYVGEISEIQPPAPSPDLTGASEWAVPELRKAIEYKLTTDEVLKDFTANLTREEFCELAVKLYEAISKKEAVPVSSNPFNDTDNKEVLKAYKLGIANGINPGSFGPSSPITRQEICVMIVRALKAANPNFAIGSNTVVFADESDINDWAKESVGFCSKYGIIKGVGENKINPKGHTTKEQGTIMIKRAYEEFAAK